MEKKEMAVSVENQPEEYIQIGVTALRDPVTREFLPAVPLYIKATPELKQAEDYMIGDIAKVFAGKMRQYIQEGKNLPREEIENGLV